MHAVLCLVAITGALASPPLARKVALVETEADSFSDEALEQMASTYVNEVSTHEWSKMASEFGTPAHLDLEDMPKVEAWYINHAEHVDRKECIEKQLVDAGYAPYRFSALETVSNEDMEQCIQHGIEDLPQTANLRQVVSNWCNHKRLFEGLTELPGDADYFLVLEDTPVINTKRLKSVVDDLIAEYRHQQWSFIQLDPYGGVAKPVGFHRGLPVYRPSDDMDSAHAYQGTHALLVKRSALTQLSELMSQRKATELSDVVMQTPSFLAISAGVAINPMVNKFHEYAPLPAFCPAKARELQSSFIQGDFAQQDTDDLWSKWPREGSFSMAQTAWWVPSAKSWHAVSLMEQGKTEAISKSEDIETFQVGTADEDPSRASCMNNAFRALGLGDSFALGLGPRRIELAQISPACSQLPSASDYNACLAKHGMDDCDFVGELNLNDVDPDTSFEHRAKVRDHVVAGTCGFKRSLELVNANAGDTPYIFMVNENAVLDQQNMKNKLLDLIDRYSSRPWSAIQLDPYGHEEPMQAGPVWKQMAVDDENAKSRFHGFHAVLLKREAIPEMLAELKGKTVGPADRIPRHTSGWLAANLGVAYDPHMAALTGMDGCSKFPSRSSHFQVSRAEVPENWGFDASVVGEDASFQEVMGEEEDLAVPRSAHQ